ncbi:MAG: D-alanyl-D-alanine carboxypeptidase family protein [Treponema sp.]|nr:D-alanyl-D-alanine carboxypeptidase family protein [Treponema sp.]
MYHALRAALRAGSRIIVRFPVFLAAVLLVLASCEKLRNLARTGQPVTGQPVTEQPVTEQPALEADLGETIAALTGGGAERVEAGIVIEALNGAGLPPEVALKLEAAAAESPAIILDLLACLKGDPFLRRLVDKSHALPEAYEPDDLVELVPGSYEVGRRGLMLRRPAAEALERMAAAARADGVVLVASSTYRSYAYQVEVYNRNVKELGQAAADRESARPGYSQHQTGLAVDFGSIDDSFAQTRAGRWILEHGSSFGWSLSFPDGYEEATGYRWESWHYRYVGEDLAAFIDTWFDGIQQYALQFIHAWEAGGSNRQGF